MLTEIKKSIDELVKKFGVEEKVEEIVEKSEDQDLPKSEEDPKEENTVDMAKSISDSINSNVNGLFKSFTDQSASIFTDLAKSISKVEGDTKSGFSLVAKSLEDVSTAYEDIKKSLDEISQRVEKVEKIPGVRKSLVAVEKSFEGNKEEGNKLSKSDISSKLEMLIKEGTLEPMEMARFEASRGNIDSLSANAKSLIQS